MTAQSQPENVRLGEDGESVVLLDQTRLPGRVEYRTVRDLKEMVEAIRTLRVRGAPAIGVFAGFCLSALARQMERAGLDTPGLLRELDRKGKILVSSRPTAVNLSWAVERMMDRASGLAGGAPAALAAALAAERRALRREDEEMWRALAGHGLSGHLPIRHRPGSHPAGRGTGDPPAGVRRRDPAPAAGGAAHRLGAASGGGGRHPDL